MTDVCVGVPAAPVWCSPDAPRPVDALALLEAPDLAGWRAAIEGPDHHDLIPRSATQALLGEPVVVVGERDGWSEVRLPWQPSSLDARGYPGWMRTAHLHETLAGWCPEATVAASRLVAAEGGDGRVRLSVGTRLPLVEADGASVLLRHPDGGVLRVPAAALERPGDGVVGFARAFLDLPYFWAGLSGDGVDCSGLVHLAHRSLGSLVPRDADDQAVAAEPVPLTDLRHGDLVFFANEKEGVHHVGIALDDTTMIHSPNCDRTVSLDAIASRVTPGETVTAGRFS